MNQGPIVFLGIFFAALVSWFGLILQPQMQIGRAIQGTNVLDKTSLYPEARSGLAQEGLQVYRSLGCQTCHSQIVRQSGAVFDVLLTEAGTNVVEVVQAIRAIRPRTSAPEAGRLVIGAPVTILEAVGRARADSGVEALDVGGAKAEVVMQALGPDIDRGWGRARSVAADFLFDRPAMPGSQRIGPDLANVGERLPSATWQYLHLYAPKRLVPGSVMPPYRFLFDRVERESEPVAGALYLSAEAVREAAANGAAPSPAAAESAGEGEEVVLIPRPEAKALVAYLLSLRSSVPLFERPLGANWVAGGTNQPTTEGAEVQGGKAAAP
jgi:cbb3-type cytochrome oxidase cytochrome c subunit